MTKLEFRFPLPPSANRLYARTRNGGVRLTDEAKSYTEEVRGIVMGDLHLLYDFPIDLETVYSLHLIVFLQEVENPGWFQRYTRGPNKGERKAKSRFKKVDVDNRIKFLQDCLVKAIGIPGDEQIFVGSQRKMKGSPGVLASIEVLTDVELLLKGGNDGGRVCAV